MRSRLDALTELLVMAVAGRASARVQNPIVLDDTSEPQPDVTLLRKPWQGYPNAHPRPADVYLLIEVANSSLEFDLGAKLELYARGGIREFWVVDLTSNRVLVHRNLSNGRYNSITSVDTSGPLEVEALPGLLHLRRPDLPLGLRHGQRVEQRLAVGAAHQRIHQVLGVRHQSEHAQIGD